MSNKSCTIWLTGYSGAGKTTIAQHLKKKFTGLSLASEILDGDVIRQNLCKDLAFSKEDRCENIMRAGFVAEMLTRHGVFVIVSLISPYREARDAARRKIKNFVEVHVKCPIEECEKRDVKGLYAKARSGELKHFTGISDPYEEPLNPEVICETDIEDIDACTDRIFACLQQLNYLSLTPVV